MSKVLFICGSLNQTTQMDGRQVIFKLHPAENWARATREIYALTRAALAATHVERHITPDRALWGSDQAASVEIGGLMRLVANIRDIEKSLGDGIKRVHDSELAKRKKLRGLVRELQR